MSNTPARRPLSSGRLHPVLAACALCLTSGAAAEDAAGPISHSLAAGLTPGFSTVIAGNAQPEPAVPGAPVEPAKPPDEDAPDLTALSLEELLQLEITTVNVLGSHTHLEREWMLAYHYMLMDMAGYRDGSRSLSNAQVLRRFPTIHTSMEMQMHMLELMYAPSDDLTLMAMLPYHDMVMNHRTRMGHQFRTESSGVGDLQVMALQTLYGDARKGGHRVLFNAGISVPTGSIDKRDDTPTARNVKLEYPMQLGSGTVDLMPGLTYLGDSKHWAWGIQTLGTVRLGRNDNDYRFGHRFNANGWVVYKINDWLAPSLRLDGQFWGNVKGRDPELNPRGNPESNPRLQGGRRVDLLFGLHLYAPRGSWKGTRLTIEGGFPVYQSLSGPQLERDWQLNVGVSRVF
jgi:hypothetical protein